MSFIRKDGELFRGAVVYCCPSRRVRSQGQTARLSDRPSRPQRAGIWFGHGSEVLRNWLERKAVIQVDVDALLVEMCPGWTLKPLSGVNELFRPRNG